MDDCYIRILEDSRPNSLFECRKSDGSFDVKLCLEHSEKQHELSTLERNSMQSLYDAREDPDVVVPPVPKRRKRSVGSLRPYYFGENGEVVCLTPHQTLWCFIHVQGTPTQSPEFQKKFRRRFRMPHAEYKRLLERVRAHELFKRWRGRDAAGKKSSPLELLLLGSLRHLGRGLTFDDLEEYTAIHEETHRVFFHVFIEYGSSVLFPELVVHPTNAQEYETHQAEFNQACLNGCAFSTDATNVVMWRCSHDFKQQNMGFKQSHPARSYNLTTNHRREILFSTKGHPSRWNDKTLAYHDRFLSKIKNGEMLQDVVFFLFQYSSNDRTTVVKQKYRGAWGLVDNGCHKWSFIQAPAKSHFTRAETRLSEWIESMRKDAECVFGILKGRFRVLKTGIRLEGCEAADKIWLTCCAVHNWLLEADGLKAEWKRDGSRNSTSSEYEEEIGDNDAEDVQQHAPYAIARLMNPSQQRRFGSQEHLRESQNEELARRRLEGIADEQMDDYGEEDLVLQRDSEGAVFVNSLQYDDFRERLVEHFTICFNKRLIVWPTRKGSVRPRLK